MSLTSAVWRRPQPAAAAAPATTTAIHVFQERPTFISSLLPLLGPSGYAARKVPGALEDTRAPDKPVNDIGPPARVSTHRFRYAAANARERACGDAPWQARRSRPRGRRVAGGCGRLLEHILPRRAHRHGDLARD